MYDKFVFLFILLIIISLVITVAVGKNNKEAIQNEFLKFIQRMKRKITLRRTNVFRSTA